MRETAMRREAVETRRPLLDEVMNTVQLAKDKGVLDKINPNVMRLLENIQPAGVAADGRTVVRSEQHDLNKPAVLVVDGREKLSLQIRKTKEELRVLGSYGVRSAASTVNHEVNPRYNGTTVLTGNDTFDRKVSSRLPHLIVVKRDAPMTLLHELDHWDFALDRSNYVTKSGQLLSKDQYAAKAEKRAYAVNREVELKAQFCLLGRKATECLQGFQNVIDEQERRQLSPRAFAKDLLSRENDTVRSSLCRPMSMLAISAMFDGIRGGIPNKAEIKAFKTLGVI